NYGYFGGGAVFPSPWNRATAAGPNIIVVMTPGNVDDLALLWNLRGAWGDTRAMPIGVPRDQLDAGALRILHEPGVTTFFGLSGGHIYLVSESVSIAELEVIAAQGHGVEVASPRELL